MDDDPGTVSGIATEQVSEEVQLSDDDDYSRAKSPERDTNVSDSARMQSFFLGLIKNPKNVSKSVSDLC